MISSNLKIFKLLYSGEIEICEGNKEDPLELFSHVNIIAIYVIDQKRLYIWIGSNASRSLKNYIVHFREVFSKDFPELRVLRYITVEAKSEPFEFFQNVGISREQLRERIKSQEEKLQPIYSEINDLEEEAGKCFEAKEYEEAIEIAKNIIILAEDIDDKYLLKDQNEFIAEAQIRAKNKRLLVEIREKSFIIKEKFENMQEAKEIMNIHEYFEDFKQIYGEYVNLTTLPEIASLLLKEEKMWLDYKYDKEYNQKQISIFENEFKKSLEKEDFKDSKEILARVRKLLPLIDDESLAKKWDGKESQYNDRILKCIARMEEEVKYDVEKESFEILVEKCKKLIQIGENSNMTDLIEKYKIILTETKEKIFFVFSLSNIEIHDSMI